MSRGFDRNDLVREKAVHELSKGSPQKDKAHEQNSRELVHGSEEWIRARDEARAKMKEKAQKMREETLAHQKELEQYGSNGDYESANDGRSEASNPSHTY